MSQLSATTKKRLLKLAGFLDNEVPSRNFDLDDFVRVKDGDTIEELVEHKCGSVACAVGYMPMVFRDCKYKWDSRMWMERYNVVYNGHTGFDAAASFFNLSNDQVWHLFDPNYYPEKRKYKKYVTNRIRSFVKRDGKVPECSLI